MAAIFAITIHAAILGVFLVTTPRFWSTARERRPMSLEIVEPSGIFEPLVSSSPRAGQSGRRVVDLKRALTSANAPEASQAADSSPSRAASAPPTPQPRSTAPAATDTASLGRALRGSIIGCAQARMAELSDAQRQHCQDSLALDRAGAADLSQLAISPEKRAIFDAAWKADHSPQHMAGVVCLARFGGRKLEWLHPSEGVKLGPLPCYVFTPKATFSADAPHARGW